MRSRSWVFAGGVLLGVTGGWLLAQQRLTYHRRDLFSPHALRRLAALGYMAGEHTSVDHITLLRDFIAWEPRPLLKSRAQAIVRRMEDEARLRELERA